MNRLSWRISAGAAVAALSLATGVVATVPASAAPRDSTVTCPTVNPQTGAVTPKPTLGVNWSGCDLAGADLSRAPLDFADLSGANLTGANVARAGFEETDFIDANLTGVSGNNTDFNGTDFTGADLTAVKLPGGSFPGASFASAILARADLDHSDLGGVTAAKADLAGANLTSDRLNAASFSGASLKGANLAHVALNGARLAGANLAGVTSGGLVGLADSLPAGFSVSGGYLIGPYANLAGANLAGAFAVNDSFAHANVTRASLAGADLASADFAGANLAGASLKGADLTGAELTATNASLKNVAWSAATTCPNGHLASAKTGCFARPAVARPPGITVSVRRGARGTALTLTGSGFAGSETLVIGAGGTRLAAITTSGTGSAGPVALTIPAAAQPGLLHITATGKAKGQAAAAWFTVAAGWDQARYDAGLTSDNTIENTLSPAKVRVLGKKFVFNPGAGTAGAFPASVDDGAAFVASAKGPLTAVSATTGKTLWTWKEPASWGAAKAAPHDPLSQPVVVNGVVYLSVAGQGLVGIGSGKLLWQSALLTDTFDGVPALNLSQPTLADGVLYTAQGDTVWSVDPATGIVIAETAPAGGGNCGQPAVAVGVVYVRCDDGNLYAFSGPLLAPLWTYAVPGNREIGSTAVSGGTVYVTTTSPSANQLVAVSTSTHTPKWSFKAPAALNAPAVAGGVVYAVARSGVLYALNAATGTVLWSKTLHDGAGEHDTHGVAVAGGVAYTLNANGAAYAFNGKTGAQLWTYQAGDALQATPVIANGIVYIGTRSGGVEAFAAR